MGFNPRAAFFDNTKMRKFLEDMLKSVIQLLSMEKIGLSKFQMEVNFKFKVCRANHYVEPDTKT